MKIKALVIDLDGTLYRTMLVKRIDAAAVPRAHQYLRKKGMLKLMKQDELKDVDSEMRAGGVSGSVRMMSTQFNLNYVKFNTYVNDLDPKKFSIKRDKRLVSLITQAEKRYKVFVFTNAVGIWTKRVLRTIGLQRLIPFKNVVCLECMGAALKPDKEAYYAMMRITGMEKNEILFLDDKQSNVSAARRLGIKSIKVVNSDRNKRNSIYSILERMVAK